MSDFKTALGEAATLVERTLDEALPQQDGLESTVVDAMRYAVLGGGKRFRPFLTIACADLFGVSRRRSSRVGAAVEMVHCYSLIHDDLPCMDDDDLRRGRPTVHRQFDEATAVLAGDALLSLAFEMLADERTHRDPMIRVDLVRALAEASGAHGMVGGQAIDLAAERLELDIGGITRMQQLKTGALLAFACEVGGVLGQASDVHRHALLAYAHDLGLAFQITDDILDVEGSEQAMGKAVGKDKAAGKATFVSHLGLERAKTQATMLADQAARHLEPFGDGAKVLCDAAQFAINRSF